MGARISVLINSSKLSLLHVDFYQSVTNYLLAIQCMYIGLKCHLVIYLPELCLVQKKTLILSMYVSVCLLKGVVHVHKAARGQETN